MGKSAHSPPAIISSKMSSTGDWLVDPAADAQIGTAAGSSNSIVLIP